MPTNRILILQRRRYMWKLKPRWFWVVHFSVLCLLTSETWHLPRLLRVVTCFSVSNLAWTCTGTKTFPDLSELAEFRPVQNQKLLTWLEYNHRWHKVCNIGSPWAVHVCQRPANQPECLSTRQLAKTPLRHVYLPYLRHRWQLGQVSDCFHVPVASSPRNVTSCHPRVPIALSFWWRICKLTFQFSDLLFSVDSVLFFVVLNWN